MTDLIGINRLLKNQRRQEKGTENGGKSNVQNFKDKYNIYN